MHINSFIFSWYSALRRYNAYLFICYKMFIVKVYTKITAIVKKAFEQGWSNTKLACSVATGFYIALSPFPGLHTVMMFIAKWLWELNMPILFIATSINNPWTMIPIFYVNYTFGYWLIHSVLGLNPSPSLSVAWLFGEGRICLWSFFIGGNLLGTFAGLISYPIALYLFKRFSSKIK